MKYLFLFMGFLSFITCSFFLEKILSPNLKRYSFVSSISIISLLLYFMTFAGGFYVAQYLIYAFTVTVLMTDALKNKFSNFKIFFNSNKLIFILSLVWFLLTFKVQILQWDDFSWASFVKHLNQYGTYWNSNAAILEQGLRYFPGLSLWETFFIGKNYYFEQPLFFALGLIFVSVFHACLPKGLDKKKTFYFVVLFCAPISWFTVGIGNISSETTMALLLGVALCSTLELTKAEDVFVPFIVALYLAITKETGFLLALLIILLVVIQIIRKKIFFSKWLVFSVACLAMMLIDFQLWQIYLKKDPLLKTFNSDGIFNQMQQDFHSVSVRTKETLASFFKALYNRPIGRSFLSRLPIPMFEYIKGFYIFWALAFATFFFKIRDNAEYLITYLWGLFGYTLVMVVTFLYFFGEYEGRNLASYERYMGVYFMAFSILAIKIMYDRNMFSNKIFLRTIVIFIIFFPPSPRVLYPPSLKYIVPEETTKKLKIRVDHNVRLDVATIVGQIKEKTPDNSKVWLIWQNTVGYEAMIVRYEIAPRKMNVGIWSVGEKYYDGDVWTINDTLESLSSRWKEYDYVALGFVDDKFITKYGKLFQSTPKNNLLYNIIKLEDSISLKEVE